MFDLLCNNEHWRQWYWHVLYDEPALEKRIRYERLKQMSNGSLRTVTTPVEASDFNFQPMVDNYRERNCAHVTCKAKATQVRYKKNIIDGGNDKSSKTFVCEEHLLTTNI